MNTMTTEKTNAEQLADVLDTLTDKEKLAFMLEEYEQNLLDYWGTLDDDEVKNIKIELESYKEQNKSLDEIRNAIDKAKKLCQPLTIGLTEQDRKEISAYNTALNNFENIITKKLSE